MQQLWLGFFGRGAAQAYEATFGDGRKPDGEQARRRSLTRCRARGWALAQAGAHPMRRRGVWTRAYAAFGGRKNGKTMKPSVVRWTSAARAPAQRRACSSDTAFTETTAQRSPRDGSWPRRRTAVSTERSVGIGGREWLCSS